MYLRAQNASGFVKWRLKILKSKSPISFNQEQRCYIWPYGGPFLLLGFDFSYYTMSRDFEVEKLGLALVEHTLGQFVHKSGHPSIDAPWQESWMYNMLTAEITIANITAGNTI